MKPAKHIWVNDGEYCRFLAVTDDELLLLRVKKRNIEGLSDRLLAGTCTKFDLAGATRINHDQIATIERAEDSNNLIFYYLNHSDQRTYKLRFECANNTHEVASSVAITIWDEYEMIDAPQSTREILAFPGMLALMISAFGCAMLVAILFPSARSEFDGFSYARAVKDIAMALGLWMTLAIWIVLIGALLGYALIRIRARPIKSVFVPTIDHNSDLN